MQVRECRRCPATFPMNAEHCPQCGNCDYVTVQQQPAGTDVPQVSARRGGRGRVKAVA